MFNPSHSSTGDVSSFLYVPPYAVCYTFYHIRTIIAHYCNHDLHRSVVYHRLLFLLCC